MTQAEIDSRKFVEVLLGELYRLEDKSGVSLSSPAQNEAFTTRTVDAAEELFLGKGQQLTGPPPVSKLARCRT